MSSPNGTGSNPTLLEACKLAIVRTVSSSNVLYGQRPPPSHYYRRRRTFLLEEPSQIVRVLGTIGRELSTNRAHSWFNGTLVSDYNFNGQGMISSLPSTLLLIGFVSGRGLRQGSAPPEY